MNIMIIIIKILEALLRIYVTSITEFRDPSLGHIHFHNSRDENEIYRRQSRSLLAKWKKSAISNTGAALSSTGENNASPSSKRSRDAIGQKRQPHTFTHHQSHLD